MPWFGLLDVGKILSAGSVSNRCCPYTF